MTSGEWTMNSYWRSPQKELPHYWSWEEGLLGKTVGHCLVLCSAAYQALLLSRLMSHHGRGEQPCSLCDSTLLEVSVMEHALTQHWAELSLEQETDVDWLLNWFVDLNIGEFVQFCPLTAFCICIPLRSIFVLLLCSLWASAINLWPLTASNSCCCITRTYLIQQSLMSVDFPKKCYPRIVAADDKQWSNKM